jgi:hypothetical protein
MLVIARELKNTLKLQTLALTCYFVCLLWLSPLCLCFTVNPWLCKVMHELLTEQGLGSVLIYQEHYPQEVRWTLQG